MDFNSPIANYSKKRREKGMDTTIEKNIRLDESIDDFLFEFDDNGSKKAINVSKNKKDSFFDKDIASSNVSEDAPVFLSNTNNTPLISMFSSDNVEPSDTSSFVSPETDTPPIESKIVYTSYDLANELDCSPQTIRNYANTFNEFLSNEKNERGHRLFSPIEADLIHQIYYLTKVQHYTKKEVIDALREKNITVPSVKRTPMDKHLPMQPQQVPTELVEKIGADIIEKVATGLSQIENNLENQVAQYNQNILQSLSDTKDSIITAQSKEIERLRSILGNVKHTSEETSKAISSIPDSINESLKESDEQSLKQLETATEKIIDSIKDNSFDTFSSKIDVLSNELSKRIDSSTFSNEEVKNMINKHFSSQQKIIQNIDANVRKGIKSSLATNQIKNELTASIDDSFTKTIKDNLKPFEELIISLKNTHSTDNAVENEDYDKKLDAAKKTIEKLASENQSLKASYNEALNDLKSQNDTIIELKNKINTIMKIKNK